MALHGKTVAVIIPALNEAPSIDLVLKNLPSWIDTVIVADNGSTDNTAAIARANGAIVVFQPKRGYGAACLSALETLAPFPPDVVLFIDADFSDNPHDALKIAEPVCLGMYDTVLGSRTLGKREKGALTPQQLVGNALATRLIQLIWNTKYSDLGPFRAIQWSVLQRLNMCDATWGWTVEMQIKIAAKGLRFLEVPVEYRNRIGKSKISGTVSGTIKAGYKILTTIGKYGKLPLLALFSTLAMAIGVLLLCTATNQRQTAPIFWLASTTLWAVLVYCIRTTILSKKIRTAIVYTALLGNILAMFMWGILSTDIHRYMWDGHVLKNQVSPYLYAPNSPVLQPLHTNTLPAAITYKELPTIYPPVAQAWFAVSSYIGTSWWGWKIPTLLCLLGSCVAVFRLVRIRQGLASSFLMYITAPILLLHGTVDAHLDVIMLFYVLSALVLLEGKQQWWGYIFCGALLGMAIGTKYTPLLLLPWIVRGKGFTSIMWMFLGGAASLIVAYVPFWGSNVLGSLQQFSETFTSNSLLVTVLNDAVSKSELRIVSMVLFVVGALFIWFRVRDKYRSMALVMVLFALSSPIVHPWYLLPLLAFCTVAFSWTSFTLLCTISLSGMFIFTQKNSGMWLEHPAIIYVEYVPVLLLFIAELYASKLTALQLRRLPFGQVIVPK